MEPIVEQTPAQSADNLYCIKCKSHTENVDRREEQITSKGKPRSVVKANCAVCSKKKNRFVKSVKPIEDLVKTPDTEMAPPILKKVKTPKNQTKKLETLLQQHISSLSLTNQQ